MTTSIAEPRSIDNPSRGLAALGGRWLRATLRDRLEKMEVGRLRILDADGEHVYGPGGGGLPPVTLRVRDSAFYTRVALGGSVGAGESYMAGDWVCDDLVSLVRLLVRNRGVLLELDDGWARLMEPVRKWSHRFRRNHRRGSRRNVEAHYDLGNDFYRLWLDDRMNYSCAIFDPPDIDLERAQEVKLERICRGLGLGPGDHVLEIGTGWGGFAIYAASRYGCRVTTTTLSSAQRELAQKRVREAGLEEEIEILGRDYRDLEGSYDKLVSIEMIEAVGLDYLETFFECCVQRLRPGGLMMLQTITIAEACFERYRYSVDFIQRYVFPGGALPSVSVLANASGAAGLELRRFEELGPHYATTLHAWRERFFARLEEVRSQGFSENFIRMWEFYLCYCEGGFLEGSIGDTQIFFARPAERGH